MKHVLLYLIVAVLSLTPLAPLSAEVLDSAVTVSLITCSPGQEAYSLYGHTALRVRGTKPRPYDVAFNYGVFDFNTPNFVWRFVLGETDYIVMPVEFNVFLSEYSQRGSSVTEQVLNLNAYEADTLARDLWLNSLPQNRVYRYNFFTNNCTTKALDMVESHIDGVVVYPVRRSRYTYRELVHQYTAQHPWSQEGNDLLLGAEADTLIGQHEEMFLPFNLMHYADSAMICADRGAFRPLVLETNELLAVNPVAQQAEADAQPSFPLTPLTVGWLVFALAVLTVAFELYRGKLLWQADVVLLTVQGVMGLLIAFMVLFSTHPTVSSNWQVWVLNPLPLCFLWWVVKADRQGSRHPYHIVACLLLGTFLVFSPFIHQSFSQLLLPLTLSFLSRSVAHLLLTRQGVKRKRS